MEPFAYEKPKSQAPGRLFVAGVAVASLSIWYFDLIPTLDQVPTGTVDSDQQKPSPNDFLAMLEAEKQADDSIVTAVGGANGFPTDEIQTAGQTLNSTDSVYDRMVSDNDPIENSFPEFADLTEPDPSKNSQPTVGNSPAAGDSTGQFSEIMQAGYVADPSSEGSSGIQTASMNRADGSSAGVILPEPPPAVLTAETAAKLRTIDELIQQKSTLRAHAMLSELYWNEPTIRPTIQDRIDQTAAEIYINPNRHFAEPYLVDYGETLQEIAKKHSVSWTYLARLNAVTPKTLQAGQTLKVLKGPFGAVVDLDNFELTVHAHGWYVRRYRIGTGKDQSTPTGNFTIQNKLENPQWYNPDGGVVDADDPSNPLGEYWLGLGNHIGIHGTIDPASIGKAQSRGCVHMSDADIAEVFNLLSVGSPVKIRQ